MASVTLLSIGEATATGGDITLKTVKDATWDARAKWYHLAINLDVDIGTIDVSIAYMLGLCEVYYPNQLYYLL